MEIGQVFVGEVKSIVDFGAYIDIDGKEALLRSEEICWGKCCSPKEILTVGQQITVIVLRKTSKKVVLSHKRLNDPWKDVVVNKSYIGRIAHILKYAIHVEIFPGVSGMIMSSELPGKTTKYLQKDQKLKVTVMDLKERKLSLKFNHFWSNPCTT